MTEDRPSPDAVDTALREARMLLSLLGSPALRAGIGAVLSGEGSEDPAITGPLSRLPWLGADGTVDHVLLRARVEALSALRGDGAILSAAPIADMPAEGQGLLELSAEIARLAWARMGSPAFATEGEVTAALAMFAADAALVRRSAVDAGVLRRTPDGARYTLAAEPAGAA